MIKQYRTSAKRTSQGFIPVLERETDGVVYRAEYADNFQDSKHEALERAAIMRSWLCQPGNTEDPDEFLPTSHTSLIRDGKMKRT